VSEPVESSSNGVGLVTEAMAPLLLTVNQAAAKLGIGRSTMYTLMYRGDIRPVHIGRSVRIHPQDLEQFVAGLQRERL
jgi:excisionase family DNA binding protein